jgi:hypothetical protein
MKKNTKQSNNKVRNESNSKVSSKANNNVNNKTNSIGFDDDNTDSFKLKDCR